MRGEIAAPPWEYGYATLGHRLIYSRRSALPPGVAVGATLNLGDKDALVVRDYARTHPYEDVDAKTMSAEARGTLQHLPLQKLANNHQYMHDLSMVHLELHRVRKLLMLECNKVLSLQYKQRIVLANTMQSTRIQVVIPSVCILKLVAFQVLMVM